MENILKELRNIKEAVSNTSVKIDFGYYYKIYVYPKSIIEKDGCVFFIGKEKLVKSLYIYSDNNNDNDDNLPKTFDSVILQKYRLIRCTMDTKNRKALQSIFDFTNPKLLGVVNSIGMGDRIGLANPGHIRALKDSKFRPVLAQQSIRELTRTQRSADEVMDAAVWAVFQEGFMEGFGADADHLKTTENIDMMVNAGFKMFTFDPGDYVDNSADSFSLELLNKKILDVPWNELKDTFNDAKKRYSSENIKISDDFTITLSFEKLLKAYVKYGKAIAHIYKMYNHLKNNHPGYEFEVEVSVDETESVTSPFEHFFFVNELKRLNVEFVSLAPRFIGDFEKGIDYKGNIDVFKEEYKKHLAIIDYFGNYKISLHSGSDKFSVYEAIGSFNHYYIHVKTAGTSYLEALKVTAINNPGLFRRIWDFSMGLYEVEKKSYHVSADIKKVKKAQEYTDQELIGLFNSIDARQIMHVTFGRVLTEKSDSDKFLFKDEIINCLIENEDLHYDILIQHFQKHIKPFCKHE